MWEHAMSEEVTTAPGVPSPTSAAQAAQQHARDHVAVDVYGSAGNGAAAGIGSGAAAAAAAAVPDPGLASGRISAEGLVDSMPGAPDAAADAGAAATAESAAEAKAARSRARAKASAAARRRRRKPGGAAASTGNSSNSNRVNTKTGSKRNLVINSSAPAAAQGSGGHAPLTALLSVRSSDGKEHELQTLRISNSSSLNLNPSPEGRHSRSSGQHLLDHEQPSSPPGARRSSGGGRGSTSTTSSVAGKRIPWHHAGAGAGAAAYTSQGSTGSAGQAGRGGGAHSTATHGNSGNSSSQHKVKDMRWRGVNASNRQQVELASSSDTALSSTKHSKGKGNGPGSGKLHHGNSSSSDIEASSPFTTVMSEEQVHLLYKVKPLWPSFVDSDEEYRFLRISAREHKSSRRAFIAIAYIFSLAGLAAALYLAIAARYAEMVVMLLATIFFNVSLFEPCRVRPSPAYFAVGRWVSAVACALQLVFLWLWMDAVLCDQPHGFIADSFSCTPGGKRSTNMVGIALHILLPHFLPRVYAWHWGHTVLATVPGQIVFCTAHDRLEGGGVALVLFTLWANLASVSYLYRDVGTRTRRNVHDTHVRDAHQAQVFAAYEELRFAKRAARMQTEQRKQLHDKQAAQQKLMGFICHELRAPLHTTRALTHDLVERLDLPAEVQNDLSMLDQSTAQMSLIINDVLDLVSVQAGHTIRISPAMVDIRTALKATLLFVRSYAQVPVSVHVDSLVPDQVFVDELRVKQLVINGLSNACKLTTRGSIEVNAALTSDNQLLVEVVDTGPGVDGVAESRLFAPFDQVAQSHHSSKDRFMKGTGLGLSLCKNLVEQMAGVIHLQPRTDGKRGARFWFSIPLTKDSGTAQAGAGGGGNMLTIARPVVRRSGTGGSLQHPHAVYVRSSSLASHPSDTSDHDPAAVTSVVRGAGAGSGALGSDDHPDAVRQVRRLNLRVLACDDSPVAVNILGRMLQRLNCEATLLTHSKEVEPTLAHAQFDAVLLDVNMAEENGDAICKRMRMRGLATPAIATTGMTDAAVLMQLVTDSGFNTVLSKPFSMEQLAECLNTLVSSRSSFDSPLQD